jgi:hypothetical protein
MKTFKDALGREWSFHFTCGSLKRLAASVGFDLADMKNNKAVELFCGDYTHLLDILWALCKKTAGELGISEEQFGEGLRGDVLSEATEALEAELLDFFPLHRRQLLGSLLARAKEMQAAALAQAARDIEALQVGSDSGGQSPTLRLVTAESTPTAGLSASS